MTERTARGQETARRLFNTEVDLRTKEGEPDSAADLRANMFNQAFADSWTRTALDDRTRSMLTIAMLAALGSADELRTHVAGALACGVTPDELVDVFAHISSYAGVARAVPGWAVASSVIRSVSARTNPTDVDPRLT